MEKERKLDTFSVDKNKRRSSKDDLAVDRNLPTQWSLQKSIVLNENEE